MCDPFQPCYICAIFASLAIQRLVDVAQEGRCFHGDQFVDFIHEASNFSVVQPTVQIILQ